MVLIFKESSFQIILTKLLPHAHFRFNIFNPIMLLGIKLFNLAPVKNIKSFKFLATSPHHNPTTNTSYESLRTYISRLHHIPHRKESIYKSVWISSSACPYQGYGQSNVYVFGAVFKARKISRTVKKISKNSDNMYCLMKLLLICLHIWFKVK